MVKKKKKHNYLEKKSTTRIRQDYLDIDYVDGVKNKNGETVIRGLNEKEKDWLNNFMKEYLNGNDLSPTEEIKGYVKKARRLEKNIKKTPDGIIKDYREKKLQQVIDALEFLRHEAGVINYEYEHVKDIYRSNYSRRKCIFNSLKSRGMLVDFEFEKFDQLMSNDFTSDDLDPERFMELLEDIEIEESLKKLK